MGLIGLAQAGKKTMFEALTRTAIPREQRMENRLGTIHVPDSRIDHLSSMYGPRKTTYAQVRYFLPGQAGKGETSGVESPWVRVRDADALIHVVRNFQGPGMEPPDPGANIVEMEQELVLADLMVVEKRLERLDVEKGRGRSVDPEEHALLVRCRDSLEAGHPLRRDSGLANSPVLRGFTFLSAKPMLLLFNNDDEDDAVPGNVPLPAGVEGMAVRGKLEHEIVQMEEEQSSVFFAEYGIGESAMDRVIKKSYALLGLISFFTVGEDEVRAWTARRETPAVDAAEVIHSDIKKGFIRAEVVHYDDLLTAQSYAEARRRGTVRLEGKAYTVKDADIIDFRFAV